MAGFTPDPSWPTILELATQAWGEQPVRRHGGEVFFGSREARKVNVDTHIWKDFEANTGGGYVEMWGMARGGPLPPRTNGQAGDHHPAPIVNGGGERAKPWEDVGPVRYPYHGADGSLFLEVFRTLSGKPRFRQRCPSGFRANGEIKWKYSVRHLPGHDQLLYRFPELMAADPAATVFVCEGEKDVDNLAKLGLIATTNIGGAGKWRPEYAAAFHDRPVVILPDNDQPGEAHAAAVARSLTGVAASVKVLRLPGLLLKGDVSDWLADGGTRDELEYHAREAPIYVPPPAPEEELPQPGEEGPPVEWDQNIPPGEPGDRRRPGEPEETPVIYCRAGELPRMIREAEAALLTAGMPIYQRSVLVRPAEQEYPAADGSTTHSAALVHITGPAMMGMLASVAIWMKYDARSKRDVVCDPPTKVVDILLASRGDWRFPVVRGVLTSPTIRPDGSLLMTPGYDPVSRYYLMFPTGLELPDIPDAPTYQDAKDSLYRLHRLLDGYKFVDAISRSVALAILMTQVLRCGMAVSPLLAVSATAPGTGKSHLIDLASTISIGRPCPIMGAGKNDEETEKGINTNLLSGVAGFSIDNVHRTVDLAVLNIATERPMIGIRLFGTLDKVEVENAVTIFMTGNNLPIVDEQVRRTVLCRMDAGEEDPEQREFDSDPIQTVLADRGRYIADILIIARAYLANGSKRAGMRPYGSYPGWSRLVREPLIWLSEPDPVASQIATKASDPEGARLRSIITAWHAAFQLETHTLTDVVATITAGVLPADKKAAYDTLCEVLREAFPGRGGAMIDTYRWGIWMRKFAGRVVDRMRFVKDEGNTGGAIRWQISVSR
jgi:putative DNA primase/helicase